MASSAADIAAKALRYVGVLSPYDTGVDASQYAVALDALQDLLDEILGTEQLWFFVPSSQSIPLSLDVGEYDLNALLETDLQFIHSVFVTYPDNGLEEPATLIRKDDYDLWKTDMTGTGNIQYVFVEKKEVHPLLKVLRKPQVAGVTMRIEGQRYADDIKANGGRVDIDFPRAWTRFLSYSLARDIGSGPVVRLPENELARFEREAMNAQDKLQSYQKRANVRFPRFTKFKG